MRPELFHIGPLPIYAYGFMILLGFITGMKIATTRFRIKGMNPDLVYDLGLVAMVSGILGARIFYLIQYHAQYDWRIFNLLDGLSPLGGVVGIMLFVACYWHRQARFYLPIIAAAIVVGKYQNWLVSPGISHLLDFVFLLLTIYFFARSLSSVRKDFQTASRQNLLAWLAGVILSLVVGMRLFYCYRFAAQYSWDMFMIWRGGLVFYGGFIGATIALIWFFKSKKLPVWKTCDILAPCVALGLGFTRIGCFLNGCCFGGVCPHELDWGVHYPSSSLAVQTLSLRGLDPEDIWQIYAPQEWHSWTRAPYSRMKALELLDAWRNKTNTPRECWNLSEDKTIALSHLQSHIEERGLSQHLRQLYDNIFAPVYPAQLLASLNGIFLFFILTCFYRYRKNDGEVLLVFGILYSIARFYIETLRNDTTPVFGTGLTVSQNISVILFCSSLGIFIFLRGRNLFKRRPSHE